VRILSAPLKISPAGRNDNVVEVITSDFLIRELRKKKEKREKRGQIYY